MAFYEPLHHKYRPQSFADLVGQNAIATTLTHAIERQRIAPAYLFTGPRGTGKTSSARILAKSLNCLSSAHPTVTPCGTCDACQTIARGTALDVIEIDAASNTGVDNIRELIERAQFAPAQCRYKVYCLDEVHMLSTAAFNALLKTLEEPPLHVVFVLATTDPQRVLPTIISRCQRFDFRRIPLSAMMDHLSYIAAQEDIAIQPDAIALIAQIAQGGLRDAESLLDQLSLQEDTITPAQVWDLVGSVPEQDLFSLVKAIVSRQPALILEHIHHLLDRGRDPLGVLQNLAQFYRDLLIAKTAPKQRELVAITEATWQPLCEFVEQMSLSSLLMGQQHLRQCEPQVKNTTQPKLWLEVALLGLLDADTSTSTPTSGSASPQSMAPAIPASSPQPGQEPASLCVPPNPATAAPQPQPAPVSSNPPPAAAPTAPTETAPIETAPVEIDLDQLWQQILAQLNLPSRALFSQHGKLVFFQGAEAGIQISKNLARIAQPKLGEVEAALQQQLRRKIKVTLHLATPDPLPGATSPQRPATEPPPAMATLPPPSAAQPTPPVELPAPPDHLVPPSREPPQNRPAPAAPVWPLEDEIDQASRSFAEFFNGTLVTLEPDVPTTADIPE
ncbi:DNA polymerase III subunit gamma/tau [Synechococcales cyanobacterium C]|uniref:DNA polymerase III subunit gamma/tau n=1 Tax=Petrachloros mirabilis ULC683 TaxID=2781853 RepID=A0A8K1ZZG0_9CYAN|nr:DNA polymerase III subunit gamma/tau [Petrachloros mirabilis]NCJ07994.1 DNA polymerase III subunit gamma/tau [Petrachloros mirabilis ULC683]